MLPFDSDPSQDAPSRVRLEHRTTAEAKSLIEQAARALGIHTSEFVTAAAVKEARRTLGFCEVTRIPAEAASAFVAAFENEEPTPALVDLMRLYDDVAKTRPERDAGA